MVPNNQKNQHTIYDFLPLIVIFSCVIILTIIAQWHSGFSVNGAMCYFMSFFFLIFGSFKLFNWAHFVEAYRMYDIIAKRSLLYAYLYPIIEISLGLAYFFCWNLLLINSITLLVMTISAVGVAKELLAGKTITCACLGLVFKIPMTWVTLMEDVLMAAMALIMLFLK